IAGCNLACQTCETWSFSLERRDAVRASPAELAAILLDLQKAGAANANFVTPTHVLPVLLEGLAVAAEHGFSLPVVWNCGGYESVEALRLLDGVVDVYLPDAKYGDDAAAYELSGCPGYTAALEASLREMHRQAKVIVRHLVLPAGDGRSAAPARTLERRGPGARARRGEARRRRRNGAPAAFRGRRDRAFAAASARRRPPARAAPRRRGRPRSLDTLLAPRAPRKAERASPARSEPWRGRS